jgi:hypothetical protein
VSIRAFQTKRKVVALKFHPQREKLRSKKAHFEGNIRPMTLTAFLAYLFKFLSNPALLSALLAFIQKFLR